MRFIDKGEVTVDEIKIKDIIEAWETIKTAFTNLVEQIFNQIKELLEHPTPPRKQKFNIMHTRKVKQLTSQVMMNKPKFIQARSCV